MKKSIFFFLFLFIILSCNDNAINRQDHVEVATIWTNAFYSSDLESFKKVSTKKSVKSYENTLNMLLVGEQSINAFGEPPTVKAIKDTILNDNIAWVLFEHNDDPKKTSSVRLIKIDGGWLHDEYDFRKEKNPINAIRNR